MEGAGSVTATSDDKLCMEQKQTVAESSAQSTNRYMVVSNATLRMLLPELRNDLRAVLRSYAHTHPLLGQQEYEGGARHLVVHYRLGDFVGLGYCVSVASLAQVQLCLG